MNRRISRIGRRRRRAVSKRRTGGLHTHKRSVDKRNTTFTDVAVSAEEACSETALVRKETELADRDPSYIDLPRDEVPREREDVIFSIDEETEPETKGTPPKREFTALVCGSVIVFTLLAAIAFMCFAFAVANREGYGSSGEDADVSVSAPQGEKIIYVREYDSESGSLTAPEIYSKCSASVVSLVCASGSDSGRVSGIGSGFFISSDGYIATAAHVVEEMSEIYAVLHDGSRYGARVVASSAASDIALLKIDAEGVSAVTFGKSSELLVGERVFAIGTPASIDYAGTLTSGEVSYPKRTVSVYGGGGVLEKKMTLIQTNAQVNPGNSGCPLFDEYGNVIGMITMKLGAEYSGIGFAIPSDGASVILDTMLRGGIVDRQTLSGVAVGAPRLGVYGASAEVGGNFGFRIDGFSDDGASAGSSLKVGDLIVMIDTCAVYSGEDVTGAINTKSPGDTVSVTVIRSGQRLTYDVILGYGDIS